MKKITAAFVAITGFSLCAAPLALAADDSFVGKWKMNVEKSQLNGLTYKVEDAGDNKYKFVFGDDAETVSLDGKDHVTKYGETWSVSQAGPNAWKWTQKRDGKLLGDFTWTVAADGKTSTYSGESMRPDGSSSHDETKLTRTAGSSGLVGTWESAGTKIGSPTTFEFQKWETGYSIVNAAYKSQTDLKLDGKDYTPKGPLVAEGTTVSGKAMDDHNMELTYKVKGKMVESDKYQLSADGKTLSNTITYAGVSKPEVDVYERQ